jgi:N-acetylneuraminic acid mutarotase
MDAGTDAVHPEDAGGHDDVADAAGPRVDARAPAGGADASRDGGAPASDASSAGDAGSEELGEPSYETLPPLGRGVRQEHAVVTLGGRICVIGGFAPSITGSVECYDPDARSWQSIASLPRPLHHANAAVVEGKLYVLGYLLDLAFTATAAAHVYDPERDMWSDLSPMPLDRQRGSGATAVVGRDIYVIGGARGSSLELVDIYDTAGDAWRVGPSLPAPREHLCAGAIGDKVVVAGGRAGSITGFTDSTIVLEPGASDWREVAPMPTARGGCAGAVLRERLLVFGGEGSPEGSTGVFPNAEAYDPSLDTWTVLPAMPVPRHGFGAAVLDDRLYLPGGATQQAFGAVADVEVFFYR